MPQWLKNLTLVLVLLAWGATVVAKLQGGELPDATFIGVPILALTALAPPIKLSTKRIAVRPAPAASADDENEGP